MKKKLQKRFDKTHNTIVAIKFLGIKEEYYLSVVYLDTYTIGTLDNYGIPSWQRFSNYGSFSASDGQSENTGNLSIYFYYNRI